MILKVMEPRRTTTMGKRLLQKTLKHCRDMGLDVQKEDGIYLVFADQDLVIKALNGSRNYLVQYNTDLFEPHSYEVQP